MEFKVLINESTSAEFILDFNVLIYYYTILTIVNYLQKNYSLSFIYSIINRRNTIKNELVKF
jgi:hypothetical protein